MSLDEVGEKFHQLVDPILGHDRAARIAELVARIDTLDNVQAITALLQ